MNPVCSNVMKLVNTSAHPPPLISTARFIITYGILSRAFELSASLQTAPKLVLQHALQCEPGMFNV